MKILSYFQAREVIDGEIEEREIEKILTVSGRAEEWITRVKKVVLESQRQLEEIMLVEQSGMGKEILGTVPRAEWVYLVNPSLATEESYACREGLVAEGRLFSKPLRDWLLAQEIGKLYLISEREFTKEEAKVGRILWSKQESLVTREELAQAA